MTVIPEHTHNPIEHASDRADQSDALAQTIRRLALGFVLGVVSGLLLLGALLKPPYFWPSLLLAALALLVIAGRVYGPPNRVPPRVAAWLRQPDGLAPLGGLLAFGLAVVAALYMAAKQELAWEGVRWAYAAGVALAAALLIQWQQMSAAAAPPATAGRVTPFTGVRLRPLPLAVGLLLLATVSEANGQILQLGPLETVSSNVQFVLLAGGILLTGYGLAGWRYSWVRVNTARGRLTLRAPLRRSLRDQLGAADWREWIVVGALLLLALLVRAYDLRDAQRLFIDEIHFSNPVMHFWSNPNVKLLMPFSSVAAFPYLYPFMQSHAVALIGNDLHGLRAVSVLFGVAGILATYLLGRVLFNRRIALTGAALLAVLPVHMQFSRLGLNNIVDPFLGTLTLYFIARGLRRPATLHASFVWAGVTLGLTQYFYEGGRLLFPALVIFWLAAAALTTLARIGGRWAFAWLINDRARMRAAFAQLNTRMTGGLFFLLLAAGITAAPVYYTLIGRGLHIAQRMETAGISQRTTGSIGDLGDFLAHFGNRFYEAFLIHTSIPEAQLYYGGDQPFLLAYVVPFFLLGIAAAVTWAALGRMMRDDQATRMMADGAVLLLLWVGITWLGNTLLEESRISARYVVSFPAMALLCALGLDATIGLVYPRTQADAVRWGNRALVGICAALMTLQVTYYFGPYMDRFNTQFRADRGRNLDVEDAMYRARAFPYGTMITLVDAPTLYEPDINNMLHFLRGGPQRTAFVRAVNPITFDETYLQALRLDVDNAFFLNPVDTVSVERLRALFPQIDGPHFTSFDASRDRQFALYYLPAMIPAYGGEPPCCTSNPPDDAAE
ncbi:MAG: glycosyltransferase family 39 protein [Chloroflexota bacterium]